MTTTAKIFKSGNSQAVRLPKKFRINNNEVFVKKEGSNIILTPKPKSWAEFFLNTPPLSDDFLNDRENEPPQKRIEKNK